MIFVAKLVEKALKTASQEAMELEMRNNPDFYGGGMRGEKNVWSGDGRMRQEVIALYSVLIRFHVFFEMIASQAF